MFCVNRLMDDISLRNAQIEYSREFRPPTPNETIIKRWYLKVQATSSLKNWKRLDRPLIS